MRTPKNSAALLLLLLPLVPSAAAQEATRDGDTLTRTLVAPPGALERVDPAGGVLALGPAACPAPTVQDLPSSVAPEGDTPVAAAFTPDGARIVVAHRTSRNLVVFDAATRAVLATIPLSGSPNDVAVSSDGVHAVTANLWEDTASIVDLSAGLETATVAVGDQPAVVCITPNGQRAVVGNTVSQSLSVIDVATATELHRIPGAGFSASIALTPESGVVTYTPSRFACVDDQLVVHPDFVASEIDFFDVVAGTVSSVPSAASPRGVAVAPGAARAVVSHTGSVQRVTVVDTATQSIVASHPTGVNLNEPIAVNPSGTKAVASILNGCVTVDLGTGAVSPSLSTASVNGLATTADGLHALAIGFRGSLISYATDSVVVELNNVVNAYAGAVSPTGPRAALLANHNGEDMLVVNTNGAAGFLEDQVPSGPPPDGDSPRRAAVSADGRVGVTSNILSDNVTVLDLETQAVLGMPSVGNRPAAVAVTPDGSQAVVANLDSSFVSVVDLATMVVTNVPTSTRNARVQISPDGQYAYVSVVVSDGVWRIDLSSLAVQGPKLPAGEMGATILFYQETSGMTLSHDGATLVTCNSFDDTLTVIDTASWSVVTTVPVGDFPLEATFAPDDSELYVSNLNGDTVSVVANAGAASTVTATIPVGDSPYETATDGARLFVLNAISRTLGRVDLAAGTMNATAPLPQTPVDLFLNEAGTCAYVASGTFSVSIGPGPVTSIGSEGYLTVVDTASMAVAAELTSDRPPTTGAYDACGGFGIVPAHLEDDLTRFFLVDPAAASTYGCGVNPAGSLSLLAGAPILGSTFQVGIDNPLGTQPAGSLPIAVVSLAPDPSFPCGTPLAGFGMAAPGAVGELLISLAPPNPVATVVGPPWLGPGTPAPIPLTVPQDCSLLGQSGFVQGLMFTPGGVLRFGLSEGLEVTFGP